MEEEKEQLNYTLILHKIRKKLKLSLMEYCIADSIYHLSNNPNNKIQGWCYASKEHIAKFLGTTRTTIFDNINKLIKKGLVERDEETKYLRTTQKWYDNVIIMKTKAEYQEALHTVKKLDSRVSRNLTPNSKETLHYNNIDNNINNNKNNSDLEIASQGLDNSNKKKKDTDLEETQSKPKHSATLKRKDFRVKPEVYKEIIDAYQKYKGIKLQGAEFGEAKRAVKTMLYSGRTKQNIIDFMKFCSEIDDDDKDLEWLKNWTLLTIKRKMPEFLAGKIKKKVDGEEEENYKVKFYGHTFEN